MASGDERSADRLNRYLDQRTGNGAGLRVQPAGRLEESLVQTIQQLHAHDDSPAADPVFADRLLEDLMVKTAQAANRSSMIATGPVLPNGRPTNIVWPVVLPRELPRSRWALGHLATAALVLLAFAASLFALRPGSRSGQEDLPAFMPANSGTLATPDPADKPVAEFDWETHGGPDVPFENKPYALTVDPEGNLWVLDGPRHQFQIFTPDGEYLESWGAPGSEPGEFNFLVQDAGNWPSGDVAFDPEGNIYVSDPGNFRIQKFGPDRTFIAAWGSKGGEAGQFRWPGQIERDANGLLYVPDEFRHDVQVFDSEGRYVRTIGSRGRENGQLDMPVGLSLDSDGHVWIIDSGLYRVQEFSPEGQFLRAWGQRGMTNPWELLSVGGMAIDAENRIFIANGGGEQIKIFTEDGEYLGAWGEPGNGPGEFFGVANVVLDGLGNAYVSDFANERIQKFRLLPPFGPGETMAGAAAPEVLIDTDVPNMPGGLTNIMVDHWFFPAAPTSIRFEERHRGPTIVVAPGEGFLATVGDVEQPLAPDVPVVVPIEGFLTKSGQSEATAYSVSFSRSVGTDGADPGVYAENSVEALTEAIPAGAARVVLERLSVPAGGEFPAFIASDLEWIGTGPGDLGVTLTGEGASEWVSGKERHVSPHFSAPRLTPGWTVNLRNSGDAPVDVYRLRVTPRASAAAIHAPSAEILWEAKGPPDLPLDGPFYLAIAPDGAIWVDDMLRNQFQIFSPEGAFVGTWGGPEGASMLATSVPGTGAGSFDFTLGDWWLTGVGFDSAGNVYVLDPGHYRVQKFGPDREFLLSWGSYGRGAGQFVTPGALAVDSDGQVYVLDFVRHDVQVFDNEGNYLRAFGEFGGGDGQFYFDIGGSLAIAPDGTIWVTDAVQHRVQRFSPDGEFLMSIGRQGYQEGDFNLPNGVAVDAAGRVYVSDGTNGRVQVLSPDGAFLASWGPPPGDRTFSPNAIVLDGEGNAYVADYEQRRIVKYRLAD